MHAPMHDYLLHDAAKAEEELTMHVERRRDTGCTVFSAAHSRKSISVHPCFISWQNKFSASRAAAEWRIDGQPRWPGDMFKPTVSLTELDRSSHRQTHLSSRRVQWSDGKGKKRVTVMWKKQADPPGTPLGPGKRRGSADHRCVPSAPPSTKPIPIASASQDP